MAALTIQKHVDDDIDQQRELFLWKFGKDGITREDLQKEQAVGVVHLGLFQPSIPWCMTRFDLYQLNLTQLSLFFLYNLLLYYKPAGIPKARCVKIRRAR